ncbi:MAG TPA: response regulator transcription factor [Nitrospiraceae bacterium]|nr:response regulator transcription factor [Nitrospiraceae bacterium]
MEKTRPGHESAGHLLWRAAATQSKEQDMIRILIVDDHTFVRQGLRAAIADMPNMSVVGEAANGDDALAFLSKHPVDVLILDLSMPGRSGLDILLHIKRHYPATAVMVLSMHSEDEYGPRLLRAGASAYLLKDSGIDHMEAALRCVAQGGKYVTATMAEKLASRIGAPAPLPLHTRLSDREFEVLLLLGQGYRKGHIASRLGVSCKTIDTFRIRILEKLKMKTTAQLIHYAMTHRLLDQPLVVR